MINIPACLLSCEPHRLLFFGASRTAFYPSSHTRLRQLADFPSVRAALAFYLSLNLRSSFAEGSLKG